MNDLIFILVGRGHLIYDSALRLSYWLDCLDDPTCLYQIFHWSPDQII
jgi:hypothetical protein